VSAAFGFLAAAFAAASSSSSRASAAFLICGSLTGPDGARRPPDTGGVAPLLLPTMLPVALLLRNEGTDMAAAGGSGLLLGSAEPQEAEWPGANQSGGGAWVDGSSGREREERETPIRIEWPR